MSRILVLLALVGCKKSVPVAEPVVDSAPSLDVPLPVDAGVRSGTFDNGMKWFIEENARPENRVVFRLAVNAGSILEEDDQLGLAHFVEHMAFNGMESFPGNELISFLESVGTKFGPHLNAHTSFEETVYKLTVPTDDPKAYDTAFQVVSEWACCLTMDPEEMEKERGVVLEEWRTRLGAQSRITEATLPKAFYGSRYPDRLPIGTEESLKTFETDAATRFYKDWYHPANMAIIVVGDVQTDDVLAKLEQHFASIPAKQDARERPEFEIPSHTQTLFALHADPEVSRTSVALVAKYDDPQKTTYAGYRTMLLGMVGTMVLNERLGEIAQRPGAPFLGANAGTSRMTPTEGSDRIGALAHEGQADQALAAILTEVKRFAEHGALPGEVERAKARILDRYGSMLKELENTESRSHADEIVRHVLQGETMPGTEIEVEIAEQHVPGFTLDEVNTWARAFLPEDSRVVTVVQPEKEGFPLPTEEALAATIAEVEATEVAAPEASVELETLVAQAPEAGSVTLEDDRYLETLGFRGMTLSNGAQVWFKKTDFKADAVQIRGWRRRGHASIDDVAWAGARSAVSIRQASGYGEFEPTDIGKFMAGKTARVSPYIRGHSAGFRGSASPDDLGSALQLIHLAFTAPRFTEKGLKLTQERMQASIVNRLNNPNTHFADAWTEQLWPDDVRKDPMTLEQVEGLSLEASAALWKDRFSDPSDFKFFFVGALPDDFEAQVGTWIGGLPSSDAQHTRVDRDFRRKPGDLRTTVENGIEAKARFRMEYWGELEANDRKTRIELSSLADVLSVLLRERLREDLGGVYGVRVSSNTWDYAYQGYAIRIEFSCDPERIDELEAAALEVIAGTRKAIDVSYIEQEIAKNRESHEESLKRNGYWLSLLSGSFDREEDPNEALNFDGVNEALTPDVLVVASKRWLDPKRRATVRLLPAP